MIDAYIEEPDSYVASSFRGVGVGRVLLDFQVTLHVGSDSIVIESPGALHDMDGTVRTVVPGEPDHLTAASSLLHRVCQEVRLFKTGLLVIRFVDGSRLEVPPNENFEAWQTFVGGRDMMLCTPGGELAHFPPGPTP